MTPKSKPRHLIVLGISLAALLSGCSDCDCSPEESSNSQSSPTSQSNPGTIAPSAERETVTDELGTYQRDTRVLTPSRWSAFSDFVNFRDEEVVQIQDLVLGFALNEALDSIALDNAAALDTWIADVAPQYFHSQTISQILSGQQEDRYGRVSQSPILSVALPSTAQEQLVAMSSLVRDGGPRVVAKQADVYRIDWEVDENFVETYSVAMAATGWFRVSDANQLSWLINNSQLDCAAGQCDYLVDANVQLRDNLPGYIAVFANFELFLELDGQEWRIKEIYSEFSLGEVY